MGEGSQGVEPAAIRVIFRALRFRPAPEAEYREFCPLS